MTTSTSKSGARRRRQALTAPLVIVAAGAFAAGCGGSDKHRFYGSLAVTTSSVPAVPVTPTHCFGLCINRTTTTAP